MINLCVRRIDLEDGRFIDRNIVYRKQLNQIFKIGRAVGQSGNDIVLEFGWVSAYHGLLYVREGLFGSNQCVVYRDLEGREGWGSTFGSNIINWKKGFQGEQVRNRDVRLDPYDWIVFSHDGKYGTVLVPYLESAPVEALESPQASIA